MPRYRLVYRSINLFFTSGASTRIVSSVFFFFFQAEDGIRDGRVTGVQTCALPIWNPGPCAARRRENAEHFWAGGAGLRGNCRDGAVLSARRQKRTAALAGGAAHAASANLSDARRAGGSAGAPGGDSGKI